MQCECNGTPQFTPTTSTVQPWLNCTNTVDMAVHCTQCVCVCVCVCVRVCVCVCVCACACACVCGTLYSLAWSLGIERSVSSTRGSSFAFSNRTGKSTICVCVCVCVYECVCVCVCSVRNQTQSTAALPYMAVNTCITTSVDPTSV